MEERKIGRARYFGDSRVMQRWALPLSRRRRGSPQGPGMGCAYLTRPLSYDSLDYSLLPGVSSDLRAPRARPTLWRVSAARRELEFDNRVENEAKSENKAAMCLKTQGALENFVVF